MRHTSAGSVAVIGALLLFSGGGWLALLDYEHRDAPDWLKYEWTAPWTLRVMLFSGLILLIWAGVIAIHKFVKGQLND